MNKKTKILAAALPLALSIAACNEQGMEQEGMSDPDTMEAPQTLPDAPGDVRAEAVAIARSLAAGSFDRTQAGAAMERLYSLIDENIDAFPQGSRALLREDLQSAQDALQANDMQALQQAATAIADRLSDDRTSTQGD